jgi:hypothetical protein
MRELRPFIDDDGTIFLHQQEGGVAVFDFTDEEGVPRDMTFADVTFRMQGFSKALIAGDTTSQLVLELLASELPDSSEKARDYIILDSTGAVPHVILDGSVVLTGWL